MSPAPRAALALATSGTWGHASGPGAYATRLLQCRPLRGLRWRWRHYEPEAHVSGPGAHVSGPGAYATRLLQCRPLRGLRWRWQRQGPGVTSPDLGLTPPGYCNVARSAGCVGAG